MFDRLRRTGIISTMWLCVIASLFSATFTQGSLIRVKRQFVPQPSYESLFRPRPPLSGFPQATPQRASLMRNQTPQQSSPSAPAKKQNSRTGKLTLGEAAHVAKLSSPHAKAPKPKNSSSKRKPITPQVVRALQKLPDNQLRKIISSQTGGKVQLDEQQVKQFKETDPKTLAEMINSGALTAGTAGGKQSQPNSRGGYPAGSRGPGGFYPGGLPAGSQRQSGYRSAENLPMLFNNGGNRASINSAPGTSSSQGAGVTVAQVKLLQGLNDDQVQNMVKSKIGRELSSEELHMLRSSSADKVASEFNKQMANGKQEPQKENSQPDQDSAKKTQPISVEDAELLQLLSTETLQEEMRKRIGRNLTEEELKKFMAKEPKDAVKMINDIKASQDKKQKAATASAPVFGGGYPILLSDQQRQQLASYYSRMGGNKN